MAIKKPTVEELIRDYGETPESIVRSKKRIDYVEETGKLPPASRTTTRTRSVGRPKVLKGELVMINWKAEPEQRILMDASASKHGETRSDFIREAVDLLLKQRGELVA
ncbi:MAG: hypothetical protein IKZ87_08125 [Actinomycetaceae bacterium]|nr:hypothetical protein [Actinomycetaceae bacterium]